MTNRTEEQESQDIPIRGRRRAARPMADSPAAEPGNPEQSTAEEQPASANARQKAATADYTPEYTPPPRKPAEERPGAFNPLAWLVEGATGIVEEARHGDLRLSEDFWKHFYAARRESLLTARALIDSLLEQTEHEAQQVKEKAARQKRRGSIAIHGEEETAE